MNLAKLRRLLERYLADFEANWAKENYKWKDVKRFLSHYPVGVDPERFSETLRTALDPSSNLVASNHYYPASEIFFLAERKPREVKEAIDSLLYGEESVLSRISAYAEKIKRLKRACGAAPKSDGGDLRFISTLLFYAHPEEYVIYKSKEIKRFAREYETGIVIRQGDPNCILQSKALSDLVIDYLESERERDPVVFKILNAYAKKTEDGAFFCDAPLRMLAQNIIWYATAYQPEATAAPVQSFSVEIKHGSLSESSFRPSIRQGSIGRSPVDYPKRAEENSEVGTAGESFVLQIENERLAPLGLKAYWKSKNDGDGFGYDILSFDEEGNEKYIEVKTTDGEEKTPFYITAAELSASERYGERYYLYRVYRENGVRKIAYYRGAEIGALCNAPVLYLVK